MTKLCKTCGGKVEWNWCSACNGRGIICDRCGNTGFIKVGENRVASCPDCESFIAQQRRVEHSGLRERELSWRLERNFEPLPGKVKALKLAQRLLEARAGFVTLHGNFGTGKTTLLKTMTAELVDAGVDAKYIRLADVLGSIRHTFNERGGEDGEAIVRRLQSVAFLAVDEVDRVKLSDWAQEIIFRLLDERYQQAGDLLTVLALNASPDELPGELGYLASRMRAGVVLEVAGADVRPAIGLGAAKSLLGSGNA